VLCSLVARARKGWSAGTGEVGQELGRAARAVLRRATSCCEEEGLLLENSLLAFGSWG